MVYIKGMKMPTNCSDCPMCYDMLECTVAEPIINFFKGELNKFDFCTERHPRCPLKSAMPLEELTDRNVGKWIPVTERVPENGSYVLAYEDGDIMMAWYSGGEWNLRDMYEIIELKPTHWMPLPEPPKGE